MARKKAKKPVGEETLPPLRLEWRSPAELAENPRNWRRHPEAQTAALSGVIAEVGWAGACLFNEHTGRLIDGHARREVALAQGQERVPVLVGSWSEADEAKILATLDPLSAMAQADAPTLAALLAEVSTDNGALQAMLEGLKSQQPIGAGVPAASPPGQFPAYDENVPTEHACPKCGYRWSGGKAT